MKNKFWRILCERKVVYFKFPDGVFSLYRAIAPDNSHSYIFRVREDRNPQERAKEKGFGEYNLIYLLH